MESVVKLLIFFFVMFIGFTFISAILTEIRNRFSDIPLIGENMHIIVLIVIAVFLYVLVKKTLDILNNPRW